MQVTQSSFTVAEFCDQMLTDAIIVNKEYQRSSGVWPGPARSFLIDTILSGFPIPKLILYQITDVRSRRTIKEIVDGQQRSSAIFDFYSNELKLSGKGNWSGLRYDDLTEEDQQKFVSYPLSCDIFVGAEKSEVRQVFQRMNSYQVPLNRQEQRHATYQGVFKWFILELTVKYAQYLKGMGVMGERQFVRMADAALFTELIYSIENGIESTSDTKLDMFYKSHEDQFNETKYSELSDLVFADILNMQDLHSGPLMKSYHFYTLFLAVAHVNHGPINAFQEVFHIEAPVDVPIETQIFRLSRLASALDEPEINQAYRSFIDASSEGSNRINQRRERFRWTCAALTDTPNPQ